MYVKSICSKTIRENSQKFFLFDSLPIFKFQKVSIYSFISLSVNFLHHRQVMGESQSVNVCKTRDGSQKLKCCAASTRDTNDGTLQCMLKC